MCVVAALLAKKEKKIPTIYDMSVVFSFFLKKKFFFIFDVRISITTGSVS